MKNTSISILLLIILLAGCTQNVTIRPDIFPSAFIAEKHSYSVGVVFSNDMLTHVLHVKPSTYVGSAYSYNFELGTQLKNALYRTVESAYENPTLTNIIPSSGEYDRIIKFSLQSSVMDLQFETGFMSTSGRSTYAITVSMEAYDGSTMKLLKKSSFNGNGFMSQNNIKMGSAGKQFKTSIESAIQQLADTIANVLISGFGEPKNDE